MSEWIIRAVVENIKKEYTIEAIDYTAERIEEIFKEAHPEWDIKEIHLVKDEEKKQAV